MTQRVKKKSRNGCRCSWCEFHLRSSWRKKVLIERDIKKELSDAINQRKEGKDEERYF